MKKKIFEFINKHKRIVIVISICFIVIAYVWEAYKLNENNRNRPDLLKWIWFWILMPLFYWYIFQEYEETRKKERHDKECKDKELLKTFYRIDFENICKNIDSTFNQIDCLSVLKNTNFIFSDEEIRKVTLELKEQWLLEGYLKAGQISCHILRNSFMMYINRFPEDSQKMNDIFLESDRNFQWFFNAISTIASLEIQEFINIFDNLDEEKQLSLIASILAIYLFKDKIILHRFE